MDAVDIERRMEREREFWVEVAPGKKIKLLRPLMDEARSFVTDFGVAHVCEFLRDWDGFTEADLLKNGGDEIVEFKLTLAAKALRDNISWAQKAAKGLSDGMSERAKATTIVEKNSEPS